MITENEPGCIDCGNDVPDGAELCAPCLAGRCGHCGERHPDEEHGIAMRERAEDEREAQREVWAETHERHRRP